MRKTDRLFHLAIPTHDLEESKRFYSLFDGCRVARIYEDRITVDFFGDQVVCHLAPEKIDKAPELYPRHFGITFLDKAQWDSVLDEVKKNKIPFFREPFTRFSGRREEHYTFVILDPSNNLIEFKYYIDGDMAY